MNKGSIIPLLLIPISLIAVSVFGYVYLTKGPIQINSIPKISQNVNLSPSPTPFIFQELTIPYLRSRTYKSKLGSLEKHSSNSSYTSYLTSYTSDGLRINSLITVPSGDEPLGGFPAIVFIHGYIAPSIFKTTERYSDYVDYLARNGFVVFKIDLRGHGQSDGEPSGAYYSGDYVIDTLNAYSALENTGFVNPKKIGIWGHSMAGNIVFRSFVVKKDVPAVVIWAGAGYTYEDLREFRIMDTSYRAPADTSVTAEKRRELRSLHGEFDPNDSFWKQVVPTNYLEEVNGAVQLNHAVNDTVVSIEYSRNLNTILNSTKIKHELNEYSGGGHNLSGSTFIQAMTKTVDFFKRYLE